MTCSGLWPPVAVPFGSDFGVKMPAMLQHARALLDAGADGLAILGTTSEANSLSIDERRWVLDALVDDGVDAGKLLPGTGCCAVPDAVALSRHAVSAGAAGVLLLPPFFYKTPSDDGLFAYVQSVIEGVGDDRLRVYLYHIPQMAGAGWSLDLIGRLRAAFPDTVVGLKDSTGDWENTRAILSAFPEMAVFPANEAHLTDAVAMGAAGCISATANVNAAGIARLLSALFAGQDATAAQEDATRIRKIVTSFPLVPAVKAMLADAYDDPDWARTRPPLVHLPEAMRSELMTSVKATGRLTA